MGAFSDIIWKGFDPDQPRDPHTGRWVRIVGYASVAGSPPMPGIVNPTPSRLQVIDSDRIHIVDVPVGEEIAVKIKGKRGLADWPGPGRVWPGRLMGAYHGGYSGNPQIRLQHSRTGEEKWFNIHSPDRELQIFRRREGSMADRERADRERSDRELRDWLHRR